MGYFDKFPQAAVTIEGTPTIITDFFRRIAVGSRFNDVSTVLLPYFVLDGETPEIVSYKIYDTPYYHWIILHCNNIVDPRQEWPLENKFIPATIFEKYDFTVTVDTTTPYHVGDTIAAYYDTSFAAAFVVTRIQNSTVQFRSLTGFVNIALAATFKNLTTNVDGLRVNSVMDPMETVHHYVDLSNGYTVDFNNLNPNLQAITNYEYELQVNDNKRPIRILDPQYVGNFVRSFDQLVSV